MIWYELGSAIGRQEVPFLSEPCCTNRVRGSSIEPRVAADLNEQTRPDLQDHELVRATETRLPLPATVRAPVHFLHHLFAEVPGLGSPSETFAGRVVELVAELLQLERRRGRDVTLP